MIFSFQYASLRLVDAPAHVAAVRGGYVRVEEDPSDPILGMGDVVPIRESREHVTYVCDLTSTHIDISNTKLMGGSTTIHNQFFPAHLCHNESKEV